MGASPVWAQAGANSPGVVTDGTGAGLRDAAVTSKSFDDGATKTSAHGVYKFLLPAPGDYPALTLATSTRSAALDWGIPKMAATGGQNQTQGQAQSQTPAQPQTSEPAAATPPPDSLTWHGITVYGAYDIGIGFVTHGFPENGYN